LCAGFALRGFFSAGVISLSDVNRQALEDDALTILRHRHFMLYGISDVDESYVRSLSDVELSAIVDAERDMQSFKGLY
jgi:hypothetical protein